MEIKLSKLRIDLLRHGESRLSHTLRGHIDDELTEKGWQQMQSTFDHITEKNWDVVVSSPLQRCANFAKSAASTTHVL